MGARAGAWRRRAPAVVTALTCLCACLALAACKGKTRRTPDDTLVVLVPTSVRDLDPRWMGAQYDIRHAVVEGGASWPLGMKLLAPWIRTTDIKDFIWKKNENGEWKITNVPLGEGMVDFEEYLKAVSTAFLFAFLIYKNLSFNIEAPVSIHYEYDLGGAERGRKDPTMSRDEIYSWLKKDITFLKNQFKKFDMI